MNTAESVFKYIRRIPALPREGSARLSVRINSFTRFMNIELVTQYLLLILFRWVGMFFQAASSSLRNERFSYSIKFILTTIHTCQDLQAGYYETPRSGCRLRSFNYSLDFHCVLQRKEDHFYREPFRVVSQHPPNFPRSFPRDLSSCKYSAEKHWKAHSLL